MTATTTRDMVFDAVSTALPFCRGILDSFLEDFPEDKRTHQPIPGCNHLLWVLGHLAVTDDYFLVSFGGQPTGLPEEWNDLFGQNSEPVDDAAMYPSYEEILLLMQDRRAALLEWFGGMDEEQLNSPLPEEMKGFAPTFAALMSTLACHEGYHVGQVSAVRKGLGLTRRFG